MIRFLKVVILVLCAAVLLGFAFANRDFVTVSFDPFSSTDNAAFSIPAPLFAVDNVNGQQQINFHVPWEVASAAWGAAGGDYERGGDSGQFVVYRGG